MKTGTRYIKCTNCGFLHFFDNSVKDRTPKCKRCGRTNFTKKLNKKDLLTAKKVKPALFCDWDLQEHIETNSLEIAQFVTSNYSGPELVHVLQDLMTACLNTQRNTFTENVVPFFNTKRPTIKEKENA